MRRRRPDNSEISAVGLAGRGDQFAGAHRPGGAAAFREKALHPAPWPEGAEGLVAERASTHFYYLLFIKQGL